MKLPDGWIKAVKEKIITYKNSSRAAIYVARSVIRVFYGRIITDGSRKILTLDSFWAR